MSDKITVYQKPTCSKRRTALGILKERGVEFEAIDYYEQPLSVEQLRGLIEKLAIPPRDLLRKDEQAHRDLKLEQRELSDDELMKLMVDDPDLIQRPIEVVLKIATRKCLSFYSFHGFVVKNFIRLLAFSSKYFRSYSSGLTYHSLEYLRIRW